MQAPEDPVAPGCFRAALEAAIALIVTGQVLGAMPIGHFGLMLSLTFRLPPARLVGAQVMIAGFESRHFRGAAARRCLG